MVGRVNKPERAQSGKVLAIRCFPLVWAILLFVNANAYARNHLTGTNNLYLQQHTLDPVDWYPWNEEALSKARREDKPIFLSVGYSSCYWCHVADRELYSNPAIAKLMNRWYVNIKVDREERPDLDALYMDARMLITGGGGWPNNVFLTPDLKPFFAGSYFPPRALPNGTEGFSEVLKSLHETWSKRRSVVESQATEVLAAMRERATGSASSTSFNADELVRRGVERILDNIDWENGGTIGSNKFPKPATLSLLLLAAEQRHDPKALAAATRWLDAMALGGIRDQLDGGFYRYCVDSTWSVPHFEKMLNDNALLLEVYANAYRLTSSALYRQTAAGIADYLGKRLAAPEGGFYSSEDAEVDGKEGGNYLWDRAEIESLLGGNAAGFFELYDLSPLPDEQTSAQRSLGVGAVLRMRAAAQANAASSWDKLASSREVLLLARAHRPQPKRDEKLVLAGNGLAIRALAVAGDALHEPAYVALANRAAMHLWRAAFDEQQHLLRHEILQGAALGQGFLQDYALLALAYRRLGESTGDEVWRKRAGTLATVLLNRFYRAGTLYIAPMTDDLAMVPVDYGDDPIPSGTSATLELLLRSPEMSTQDPDAAKHIIAMLGTRLESHPERWPSLLAALPSKVAATTELLSAMHVKARAVREAGATDLRVQIALEVEAGYHLNANPASFDYLIPTSVAIDGHPEMGVAYPEGALLKPAFAPEGIKVYAGKVVLSAFAGRLPDGGDPLFAELTLQACTDESCLPPDKIRILVEH
jgi:uncharacterized protein